MRPISFVAIAAAVVIPCISQAQVKEPPQETAHAVAGGGIMAPGWLGTLDAADIKSGLTVKDAKFAKEGDAFHITTGPAATYWNPASKATGDYMIKATFTEPKFMNLNDHAHPYGIMIAGNDMGTDQQSYLYCAVYGTGNFIVRGFGPAAFRMNGGRGEVNAAIHKADAPGATVTQDIAVSVKGDKVSCIVNGTVVGSYDKSALVAAGKLKSTDGVYGIRSAHNTEVVVTGFSMMKTF